MWKDCLQKRQCKITWHLPVIEFDNISFLTLAMFSLSHTYEYTPANDLLLVLSAEKSSRNAAVSRITIERIRPTNHFNVQNVARAVRLLVFYQICYSNVWLSIGLTMKCISLNPEP